MTHMAEVVHITSAEHEQAFYDAMCRAESSPANIADIVADGEDHTVQLAKDKPSRKRLSYCLTIFQDGFAYGNWTNHDDSESGDWNSSKGKRGISKEDRAANEARIKKMKEEKEAAREENYRAMAVEAKNLWDTCQPASPDHPYLQRKGIKPNGARQNGNNLIIQLVADGKTCSYQEIQGDGFKLYKKDARKKGAYSPLANAGDDKKVLIISTGWATSCSIREATGLPVIAAMDDNNLMTVALDIRKKYPESLLIIAADEDLGSKTNSGRVHGEAAAKAVNGICVGPTVPEGSDLSDYNDLHATEGLDAVKNTLLAAVIEKENAKNITSPDGLQADGPDFIPDSDYEDRGEPTIDDDGNINLTGDMGLPFRILGYNEDLIYYFPFGHQQIKSWTPAGHTMSNLTQLADIQEWKDWSLKQFEERMALKEIPIYALDRMTKIAIGRGVFSAEDRIRGCGAWIDAGRVVLHCGDKLLVDGVITQPRNINGYYVYAAAAQRFKHHDNPLSNTEAQKLRHICTMPTWENPLSGLLLAGWLVIAPVCAALEWRPHIWLTGEAGSGKSTILNQIIKKVLRDISLNVDGGTTESSIREKLGYDARPVIYDEAEGKGSKFSLMDGVLALAKISSTGGQAGKRGQKGGDTRSSFCFSAIHPPIKDFASETRISMMNLKRNSSPNSAKHYDALVAAINETLTHDFGRRLLARTVKYMPNLLTNIATFKKAATVVIKNARAADQVSAMLGGLYMLGSTELISYEDAEKWIAERDWTEHTAIGEENDSERLLHYISTSIVSVKSNNGSREHTIGTLIAAAVGNGDEVGQDLSKNTLKHYSILARPDGVCFGYKNHNLAKMLSGTDWENGWSKTLARLPGSKALSCQYFGNGDKQRATKLPIKLFLEEDAVPEPEETEIDFT